MPADNRLPGLAPRNGHAFGGYLEAVHAQGFRSVKKFHHVEPPFTDFVSRNILLRLAEPGRNGVLAKPLRLPRLDELIDHPAIAVIVNPPRHTPSHRIDVKTVQRGCRYTNLM